MRARILVVRVGALGDTLMVTPLLRLLHKRHPEAEVDVLCSELAAPLLTYNPNLAHVFPLQGRNWPMAVSREKRRLVQRLRARAYGLAVLLESAPRYRELLEQIRPGLIRSFSETPFDAGLHAVVNNLRAAGISDHCAEDLDMELPLAAGDETAAEKLLRGGSPLVGVHIGWGPLGRKRRQAERLRGWSLNNFDRLIRTLLDHPSLRIVLTGSAEDARFTEPLCRRFPDERVRSIAGRTQIRELAAVIKRLDLLISVDSGPCHMAAALGTPLVVLWGPGRWEQTRPLSSLTPIRIVRHPITCAPCQSTPLQKSCRRNLCMQAIAPDEVYAEACSLLPRLAPDHG
jgi:ADP-heptose:LPS heptosyltransferase